MPIIAALRDAYQEWFQLAADAHAGAIEAHDPAWRETLRAIRALEADVASRDDVYRAALADWRQTRATDPQTGAPRA